MIQLIGMAVVAISGTVLVVASRKPDTFRVERATNIKAPAEKIFPYINDLHSWTAWSPYDKRDPEVKRTYTGADSGKGAIYEWSGNDKVGTGRMEIIETSAPSKIVIKLDFFKPFEGHNTAEFTLQQNEETTNVTWAMYGPSSFFSKLMHTFMDMDKMIGTDFAAGLSNLKAVCEK
jgi:uncharacterized protein YndB with AHSA1/START domain